MKLRHPTSAEIDDICVWASDPAILGPHQRRFGWTAGLAIPGLHVRLVTVAEKPAGFAYFHRTRLGIAEIGVTLLPDYRGLGYGFRAHEALIAMLQPGPDSCVQALTASDNASEVRILRRLGFFHVDRLVEPEHGGGGAIVQVFRRPLRSEGFERGSLTVFVTGAPGSGKTTICECLKPLLASRHPDSTVKFIWGDMLSHLSFPWRADHEQLDLKYDAMHQLLMGLLKPDTVTLVDDLFRRRKDVDRLRNFLLLQRSRALFVVLRTTLETSLTRNRARLKREVLPDQDVVKLFKKVNAAVSAGPDIVVVDNDGAKARTVQAIADAIQAALARTA